MYISKKTISLLIIGIIIVLASVGLMYDKSDGDEVVLITTDRYKIYEEDNWGDLVIEPTNSGANIMLGKNSPPTAIGIYAEDEVILSASETLNKTYILIEPDGIGIWNKESMTRLFPQNAITGEWEYYSKNIKTGKVIKIKMGEMMRELDNILGGGFIEEFVE